MPMTLQRMLASCATLMLCCTFLQAKTDFHNCPPAKDILQCTQLPLRHDVELFDNDQIVQLCDLEVGAMYLIYLNKNHPDFTGEAQLLVNENATDITTPADDVLSFKALQTCVDLHLLATGFEPGSPLTFSIGCTSSNSQTQNEKSVTSIVTDENYTPTQLIEDIFVSGNCFEVLSNSINYTGEAESKGYFSNGNPSINIEDGVVLSSGRMSSIAGPNDFYNSGASMYGLSTDPDLVELLSGNSSLYDVTTLEFDFTPTTDMVSFDFVFASDEYCEYVGSSFNDVFGFFISGPGINGPFSNNAENIALIPGTNSYIAINSVNYNDNSAYYINNIPVWQYDAMPGSLDCNGQDEVEGAATQFIEFDGFTTAITAQANLQACETYHIKLAIADVGDAYFDSAVFLKANSFNAGGNAIASTQTPGGNTSNVLFEACDDGGFIFTRADEDLSAPLNVNFSLSPLSTASSGIDFDPLPNSVTIPAGESTVFLPVSVVTDMLVEGNETIILELESSCSCTMPFIELQIADMDPLEVLLVGDTLCNTAMVTLAPEVAGGLPGYTYLWSTGETTPTISVSPTTTTAYTLLVSDLCGNQNEVSTAVLLTQSPTALISGYAQICPDNANAFLQIDFTGEGPWDIVYTIDNAAPISIINITDNPLMVEANVPGTYLLSSVMTSSCEGTIQGAGTIVEVSIDLDVVTTPVTCPDWNDGIIDVTIDGGIAPYSYVWSDATLVGSNPTGLAVGSYLVTVTDFYGCSSETMVEVLLDQGAPELEAGTDENLTCTNTNIILSGSGSTGNDYSYLWTTMNGNILNGATSLNPEINAGGTYQLEVTNNQTGCTLADELVVSYDTLAPIAIVNISGATELDCITSSTVLDGSGSQPVGQLDFEWTTSNGDITIGDELLPAAEVNAGGTYQLQVVNQNNGCAQATDITINEDENLPQIEIITPIPLTCIETLVGIDASGSSTGATFSYTWTTVGGNVVSGLNSLLPEVEEPGIYTLTVFNSANNCEQSQSVEILQDITSPIANAGATPELLDCNTPSVSLDGMASSEGNDYIYQWTTLDGSILAGANSMMPVVNAGGNYELLVTDTSNGCTANDDVDVLENEAMPYDIEFEVTPPLCHDEPGAIAATGVLGGVGPYLFSPDGGLDFYADTLFWGLSPGSYPIVVQDVNGCQFEEIITIPNVPELMLNLAPDTTINLGESYNLNAVSSVPPSTIDTLIWSSTEYLSCIDCMDPKATPIESTLFQLTLINQNGCVTENQVLVRVDKARDIFIPNAFSPNGDGANDLFMIFAKNEGIKEVKRFELFSRWGEKVFGVNSFMPNDPDYGWDGIYRGERLNTGVFVYFAEVEFIDGYKEIYKGDFTLVK